MGDKLTALMAISGVIENISILATVKACWIHSWRG
jgi:phage terminase large subunit-like protein